RNLVGALPVDTFPQTLGDGELAVQVGQKVGLLEVRVGPPSSIEFNHQLFLEILLALYFERLSGRAGGLEEGLSLLSRRSDRWAETMRLLFEMVPDDKRAVLVERFIKALADADTWDVATKILSEVGGEAVYRLATLLRDPAANELSRRGAALV